MINRLLYRLTAGLPCRLIPLDSGPYLERYYVGRLLGWTFYLHRFVRADSERHLHNHPWARGWSVILTGRYLEEVVTDLTAYGCLTAARVVAWFNRVDGAHFHRIADVKPGTWTLFAHGPRQRFDLGGASVEKGWGFLERTEDGVKFAPWPSASRDWWWTAPKGRDARRAPL